MNIDTTYDNCSSYIVVSLHKDDRECIGCIPDRLEMRAFWEEQRALSRNDMMLRDFFLGFIKIHVLHHAAQEPIYGAAMIAELAHHGYELSPGTLYPLLHSLTEQGYLTRTERMVDGRIRKYYVITDQGRIALQEAKPKIAELVREVLEDEDA